MGLKCRAYKVRQWNMQSIKINSKAYAFGCGDMFVLSHVKKNIWDRKCYVDCVWQPSGRNRVFTVGTGSVVLNARRYCRLHFSAILVSVTRVTFNAGFKHRTAFNTKMSTVYTWQIYAWFKLYEWHFVRFIKSHVKRSLILFKWRAAGNKHCCEWDIL